MRYFLYVSTFVLLNLELKNKKDYILIVVHEPRMAIVKLINKLCFHYKRNKRIINLNINHHYVFMFSVQ